MQSKSAAKKEYAENVTITQLMLQAEQRFIYTPTLV